jgi:hypothetical protein
MLHHNGCNWRELLSETVFTNAIVHVIILMHETSCGNKNTSKFDARGKTVCWLWKSQFALSCLVTYKHNSGTHSRYLIRCYVTGWEFCRSLRVPRTAVITNRSERGSRKNEDLLHLCTLDKHIHTILRSCTITKIYQTAKATVCSYFWNE